jgi:hypothetical protein
MPAVGRGTAHWSPADEDHLAGCRDCSAEWNLVQATAGIGLEVERSLDRDTIASRVKAVLESSPAGPSPARRAGWLVPLAAVAAALLRLVWTGSPEPGADGPTVVAASLLPELETLTSAELESMLQLLPRDGMAVPGLDSFEDLTEAEVSSVLEDLEG